MMKIMFICHGNICRSPMAEFIMKKLIKDKNMENDFYISSCATSSEEIYNGVGSPIYPPIKDVLRRHNIPFIEREAVRLKKEDYESYDLLIGMDSYNIINIKNIVGEDKNNKIHMLGEYSNNEDIFDPWYTRDFERSYNEIFKGCIELLYYLSNNM